jgi:FkbM family methyltransferase
MIYLMIRLNRTSSMRIPGIRHPISLRSNHSDLTSFREVFLKKEYDIPIVEPFTPEIIIDAGANVGLTSVFFSNRYPNAQVISVEPDRENFECLQKNVSDYKNIIPIKGALWSSAEEISLVDKGYGERGYIIESGGKNTVEAFSIPSLMQYYDIKRIDILKIDIEGSEKEVFSVETEKWLPVTKYLIIELHDRMKPGCSNSVFTAMSKYNFKCSIKGENLVFINTGI